MPTTQLTSNDIASLKSCLDNGDRAGFYIAYYNLTGSQEALVQAQISSFSGQLGLLAYDANAVAQAGLTLTGQRSLYPATVDDFSLQIAKAVFNAIQVDVNTGGTGVLTNQEIFQVSKAQWDDRGIGAWFPGDPFAGQYPAPSLIVNILGGFIYGASKPSGDIFDPEQPPSIPAGGQQITSPDGAVTYIIDASGKVSRRAISARLLYVYVTPRQRGGLLGIKLIHGFRKWALEKEVVELHLGADFGIDIGKTDRLFRRLGFQMVGGNYSRWIDQEARG